jgi:hypothetical protein
MWSACIFLIILLVIIFTIGIIKIYYSNIIIQKKILYNIAKRRSIELNKPLIVIGAPFDKEYGCGDICIDLNGCKGCDISIKNKVENELVKYKTNSYVIYECGVLEVVDNLNVLNEMYRVAGGKENIFAFHHLKNTIYTKILQSFYKYRGEGNIQRVVPKYPPENYYSFENI